MCQGQHGTDLMQASGQLCCTDGLAQHHVGSEGWKQDLEPALSLQRMSSVPHHCTVFLKSKICMIHLELL